MLSMFRFLNDDQFTYCMTSPCDVNFGAVATIIVMHSADDQWRCQGNRKMRLPLTCVKTVCPRANFTKSSLSLSKELVQKLEIAGEHSINQSVNPGSQSRQVKTVSELSTLKPASVAVSQTPFVGDDLQTLTNRISTQLRHFMTLRTLQ